MEGHLPFSFHVCICVSSAFHLQLSCFFHPIIALVPIKSPAINSSPPNPLFHKTSSPKLVPMRQCSAPSKPTKLSLLRSSYLETELCTGSRHSIRPQIMSQSFEIKERSQAFGILCLRAIEEFSAICLLNEGLQNMEKKKIMHKEESWVVGNCSTVPVFFFLLSIMFNQ